jgi:hypothetical protein
MFMASAAFWSTPPAGSAQVTVVQSEEVFTTSSTANSGSGTFHGATAGNKVLVLMFWDRASSGTITYTMTFDDGDGATAITTIDATTPAQNHEGIWAGIFTSVHGGDTTIAVATGNNWASASVICVELANASTAGTPTVATAQTDSSYSSTFAIGGSLSLLVGCLAIRGADVAITPDATAPTVEKNETTTGAGSDDTNGWVGTIEVATPSSPTWGASWVSSRDYARTVFEVLAA